MKILTSEQIREVDRCTIENEPITSIDLMERAASCCVDWISAHVSPETPVMVFCGMGNNGGDGYAISRLLHAKGYQLSCFDVQFGTEYSADCAFNKEKYEALGLEVPSIINKRSIPSIGHKHVIVDAIFGSGLSRAVEGFSIELINRIIASESPVISIDIPSGLFCDDNSKNDHGAIIHADHTLTFQLPKLSFLLPDSGSLVGDWTILDIGLLDACMDQHESPYRYVIRDDVAQLLHKRERFSHKGTHGHSLVIAGSHGKMGAAVLAASACLRTGSGLVSAHIPACGYDIMQRTVPEVMVDSNEGDHSLTGAFDPTDRTIGIGPGISQSDETNAFLESVLSSTNTPMVIDADAINLIAKNNDLIKHIPKESILTPHPKEFERLVGASDSDIARLESLKRFTVEHGLIVVLKGAFTAIAFPNGSIAFNSSGNPGMATAGSGDVLTGMITSLLAQGYTPTIAAVIGVHLHGLAGDLAFIGQESEESLIAGDIINCIGKAFSYCRAQ